MMEQNKREDWKIEKKAEEIKNKIEEEFK